MGSVTGGLSAPDRIGRGYGVAAAGARIGDALAATSASGAETIGRRRAGPFFLTFLAIPATVLAGSACPAAATGSTVA